MFVYYIHGFRFRGVYCFTPCLYGDNDTNFIDFFPFNVFLADDSPWRIKKKSRFSEVVEYINPKGL